MAKKRARCKTGIRELDNLMRGGIPIGNTILVSGTCGSGKTTLSMEFLVNGAKIGECGVFISVTEAIEKLTENLLSFDFFDTSLIDEGSLRLFHVDSFYEKLGLERKDYKIEKVYPLIESICDVVKDLGAKRLVIDSLTVICHRLESKTKIRDFVFHLGKTLATLGCTTLMTSEVATQPTEPWFTSPGVRYSAYGIEEAIADGIILLGTIERKGYMLRTLHVVKMRGTTHSLAKYIMDLSSDGVSLIPLLKWGAKGA